MAETKKELSKKDSFLVSLSNFLQKNRIVFIVIIVVLIVGIAVFAIARESIQNRIEKSTALAEEAQDLYQKWGTEIDDAKKKVYRDDCFELTDRILDTFPNHYAAHRVLFIKGSIYFEEEKWEEASSFYQEVYDRAPESYLAPISLNNASVAYEHAGDIDNAIEMLETLTENYKESFADIARIFFSKARLYERNRNIESAKTAYNVLIDDFSNSNWTKLARNRIIALEK